MKLDPEVQALMQQYANTPAKPETWGERQRLIGLITDHGFDAFPNDADGLTYWGTPDEPFIFPMTPPGSVRAISLRRD